MLFNTCCKLWCCFALLLLLTWQTMCNSSSEGSHFTTMIVHVIFLFLFCFIYLILFILVNIFAFDWKLLYYVHKIWYWLKFKLFESHIFSLDSFISTSSYCCNTEIHNCPSFSCVDIIFSENISVVLAVLYTCHKCV